MKLTEETRKGRNTGALAATAHDWGADRRDGIRFGRQWKPEAVRTAMSQRSRDMAGRAPKGDGSRQPELSRNKASPCHAPAISGTGIP